MTVDSKKQSVSGGVALPARSELLSRKEVVEKTGEGFSPRSAGRPAKYDLSTPFSRALKEARTSTGLSGIELAEKLHWTQARVSRVETGMIVPEREDLVAFVRACGLSQNKIEEILRLRQDLIFETPKTQGEKLDVVKIQEEVGTLVRSVKEILSYSDFIVSGLLQTPDYTAAVFRLGGVLDSRKLQKSIDVRQEWRQAALKKASSLRIVLGEPALKRPFGRALPEQLRSLSQDARRKNVDIKILPDDAPTRAIPMHSFTLFGNELVMVENFTRTLTIRNPDEIAYYRQVFELLSKDANPYAPVVELTGTRARVKSGSRR